MAYYTQEQIEKLSLRRAIMASKTLIAAIAAGGSAVVAIILICVLLCSALFFFGDENSDDYYTATGDATITQVAASQVGNHGGRKFWKWYGYNERVDWCAIFVSWCAQQCGYIESGVIPKFAGVPAGVDWFVERGQFRPNTYIPKPGDIIFIDWGGMEPEIMLASLRSATVRPCIPSKGIPEMCVKGGRIA